MRNGQGTDRGGRGRDGAFRSFARGRALAVLGCALVASCSGAGMQKPLDGGEPAMDPRNETGRGGVPKEALDGTGTLPGSDADATTATDGEPTTDTTRDPAATGMDLPGAAEPQSNKDQAAATPTGGMGPGTAAGASDPSQPSAVPTAPTAPTASVKALSDLVVSAPELLFALPVAKAFTEGPLWHPAGFLLFSEHSEKSVWRWTPGAAPHRIRQVNRKSNGLTFDAQGNLVVCEDSETTVARLSAGSGARTVLASRYQDKPFNGPNDCIVDRAGNLYFTDPWYGRGDQSDIGAWGVYRVAPGGSVTRISADFINQGPGVPPWEAGRGSPNGLALSPDDSKLYVANTGGNAVVSFTRGADGAYAGKATFASSASIPELLQPDGMKVGAQGHVFVGVRGGVLVINPDGSKLGFVRVKADPSNAADGPYVGAVTNVAFGGPSFKSLFLTSNEKIYRVELAVQGDRPWKFTSALPDSLPQ